MIVLLLFIFSLILLFLSVWFSFLIYFIHGKKIKILIMPIPVLSIISIFSGYHFLTGQLNSLPDIAFNGQENLEKSYMVLDEDFSNKNHYIHILDDNKNINKINDHSVVAGLKIIKSDNDNTLVRIKTIDFIDNEYDEKEKIAIMHSNDVEPYLKNIYRSNAEIESENRWRVPKVNELDIVNNIEKDNDISNIKKLLETN